MEFTSEKGKKDFYFLPHFKTLFVVSTIICLLNFLSFLSVYIESCMSVSCLTVPTMVGSCV